MLSTVVLPWLHYLTVMMMAGGAVAELYLLRLAPTPATLTLLPRVDRFYGITAALVLVTGILRMVYGGKGPDWYWHNGLMHALLGVFALAAAVSVIPTLRFLRWQRSVAAGGAAPDEATLRSTRSLVHAQLMLMAVVALLITLVAKGYGARAAG